MYLEICGDSSFIVRFFFVRFIGEHVDEYHEFRHCLKDDVSAIGLPLSIRDQLKRRQTKN